MFKRIDHLEIIPRDFDKSIEFYVDTFGFKAGPKEQVNAGPVKEIIYLELGDTMIELLSIEGPEDSPRQGFSCGYWGMALEVDDMSDALAYLSSKGIEPVWGPVTLPDKSIRAEVRDPDGLAIELREWVH